MLKATAGGTVFGGVVTFKDGTRVLGVTSVDVRGRASLVTKIAGPLGTHSITAFYTGSANFNASTSNTLLYTIRASVNVTSGFPSPPAPLPGGERGEQGDVPVSTGSASTSGPLRGGSFAPTNGEGTSRSTASSARAPLAGAL